jgi:hypothetical protein
VIRLRLRLFQNIVAPCVSGSETLVRATNLINNLCRLIQNSLEIRPPAEAFFLFCYASINAIDDQRSV